MELDTFASLSEMSGYMNISHTPNMSEYDIRTPISDGTTILGIIYDGGVMLACDTRTSAGNFVSHKTARKINRINENVYVCRCGASSDSQKLIELVKYFCEATKGENRRRGRPKFRKETEEEKRTRENAQAQAEAQGNTEEDIDLNKINNISNTENIIMQNKYHYIDKDMAYSPLVKHVATFAKTVIYDYKDYFYCALIVGGYDRVEKQQLYCVYLNGSVIQRNNYVALGSGSIYIQSYLQSSYKKNMKKKECFDLILNCVKYAIYNDNKSGGIIRIINITKDFVEEFTVTNTKIENIQ